MIYPDLPHLALSVRQPWAWAIIHTGKPVENRDWPTKFRGPVCVHAAKGMGNDEYRDAAHFITATLGQAPNREWLMRWHGVCAAPYLVERGGIVGTVEIVDVVEQMDSPWFFGRYGFVLANPKPCEFIPVRGQLGFFDWRKNLEETNND